jgi:RNA polymerase sigma-70 factor (ECF subfamily)
MIGRPHRRPAWGLGVRARAAASERLFADFYDELYPTVLRFFARRTRDGESAFDLTAETFAKAFEKREQFRGRTEEEAAAWLWSIARNELARYHRTRTVELGALQRLGFERPAPSDGELREVEELAAGEDAREKVEQALAALPPEHQQVIQLRFIEERSYPEIAQMLGVSCDVVRARVSRARRVLKDSEQLKAAARELEA